MAVSNRDRVRKGLDELVAGLAPFVERELKAKLGAYWVDDLTSRSKGIKREGNSVHWGSGTIPNRRAPMAALSSSRSRGGRTVRIK